MIWNFQKIAWNNCVGKEEEQNHAGNKKLWLQNWPSCTEPRTARFQHYQGCATWLPLSAQERIAQERNSKVSLGQYS